MIPYFGITEASFAIFLAVRFQSWDAMIGFVAIILTMSLHLFTVPFAPLASGIWAATAILLISNEKETAGTLFGLSGMVYLCVYFNLGIARYATIHFISDGAFIIALILAVWPKSLVSVGGWLRHNLSILSDSEIQSDNSFNTKTSGAKK